MATLTNDTRRKKPGRTLLMVESSLLFALVAIASFSWLFRTERVDNEAIGLVSFHFRWGRLTTVSVDTNRDGLIDGKMAVVSHDNQIGSKNFDDCTEGWESYRLNGYFDIHYWKDETSGVFFLELDLDGDRNFDSHFEGDDAENQLQRIHQHEFGK